MSMFELTLTPTHRLKQSVDYPVQLVFTDTGIQAGDVARLHLRYALDDVGTVDELTTTNGRLTVSVDSAGVATVTVLLSGEASGAYPVVNPDGGSRYRKVKPPVVDAGETDTYALHLLGTLIISSPAGVDRSDAVMDLNLYFEASYTRAA